MNDYVVLNKTSEAVSVGHPDKIADQIADSIFDLLRTYKTDAQSAVEVACGANTLLIFGEVDKEIAENNGGIPEHQIRQVAIDRIRKIGYTKEEYNPTIVLDLVVQSAEINNAVEENENHAAAAGDQGIVCGFATNETTAFHELHFILAHRILQSLEVARKESPGFSFLLPDAKSQVTVEYERINEQNVPVAVKHVLVSHSHSPCIDLPDVRNILETLLVNIVLPEELQKLIPDPEVLNKLVKSLSETEILINPAGAWNIGGPAADSGLSGRKLVVDNYGSAAPIGGGATAGKNLNKVDRSGAYYARNIAKSIVDAGLADKVLVEIAFAIGVEKPTALNIETFGTEKISKKEILERVNNAYTLSVQSMIDLSANLDLFVWSAEHGNYTPTLDGETQFPWEIVQAL